MIPHDPRDLEWQDRYERHDTPWDKGAPAPPLLRFLREDKISGRILVPGCGRGHEVRALAARPGCSVIGLDLSTTAITEAREITGETGLHSTMRFVAGDFLHLPSKMHGTFDWLVEHTCFCALEPWQRIDYVRAASTALRSGGRIFGIFYLNPDSGSGPPFAVSREELSALFDPYFILSKEWVPAESFPGREERELVRILQMRNGP
jgi:SAM-dependent methyltransferase